MLNPRGIAERLGMLGLLIAMGCVRLGPISIETGVKLCEADKSGVQCGLLGDSHLRARWNSMSSETWGLGIDKEKARDAYLKACDLGSLSACAQLLEFRLLEDAATFARIEGKLEGKSLRSDDAIEADLEKQAQQAAEFDAKIAKSSVGAAEILGATSQALAQQSGVTVDPKAAKALKDASKLSDAAAKIAKAAKAADDAEAANRPRPAGQGHPLLDARRGAGRASSLAVSSAEDSNLSLLGLRPPPPAAPAPAVAAAPHEEPAVPAAPAGTSGVPAAPANEAELVRKALSESSGDKTASFVRKKCQDKAADCFSLANGYSNGSFDLPKDGNIGLALFQRACEGGELNGCVMVLNIAFSGTNGVNKDKPRGKAMARSACGRGSASACFSLARVMAPTPDEKRFAEEQLATQCDGGDADGCHYLVSGDFKSTRGKRMLLQLESLCQQKKGPACTYLQSYRSQGSIP